LKDSQSFGCWETAGIVKRTSAKRLERERERESDLEGFEWCRERQRERGESGGEYSTKNLEPKPYIAYRNKGL